MRSLPSRRWRGATSCSAFGLRNCWAKAGAAAEAYASALVAAQVGVSDEDALFATLRTALTQGGVEMSDNRIRRKITETMVEARAEIMAGK